jgi:ribokinase
VVVVGAINVDLVVAVPRLPDRGETVVGPRLDRHGGGKGANAAVAAARAGARASLVGAVGDDDLGADALRTLAGDRVATDSVRTCAGTSTGTALIVVDAEGDNQITVAAGANAELVPADVAAAIAASPPASVVVVSAEVPLGAVRAAVESATGSGRRCVLNPAPVVPELGDLLDAGPVVTPNATECRQLAGLPDAPPAEAGRALAARTGAPVMVTLGAAGALVAHPGGTVDHWPAPPVLAVDTTGAGDTFTGVLAAWLAAGAELDRAVAAAVVASALSVTAAGARAGMPDAGAILAALG